MWHSGVHLQVGAAQLDEAQLGETQLETQLGETQLETQLGETQLETQLGETELGAHAGWCDTKDVGKWVRNP